MATQDVDLRSPGSNVQDVTLFTAAAGVLYPPVINSTTTLYGPTVTAGPVGLTGAFLSAGSSLYAPGVEQAGSIVFNADLDKLAFSGIPSVNTFTIGGWFKLNTDRNAVATVFGFQSNSGSSNREIRTNADGTSLKVSKSGTEVAIGSCTVGTWYYVAMTWDSGAAVTTWYFGDESGGTLATGTTADSSMSSLGQGYIGGSPVSASSYLDGQVTKVRVWNVALTAAEVQSEYTSASLVKTASNLGDFNLDTAATKLVDSNGGTYPLTAPGAGSWTAAVGPTLPAGGGTQTLTGAFLSSGLTLYAPTVVKAVYPLTGAFIGAGSSLHAPSAGATYGLSGAFLSSTAALYGATVTPGAVSVAPPVIGSTIALYSPVVGATYDLAGAFLSSTAALYSPTATPGAVSVSLAVIGSTVTLYGPVAHATYGLAGAFVGSTAALYSPTTTATYGLSLPVRGSTLSLYAPTLVKAVYPLVAPFISATTTLYTGSISQSQSLVAPFLSSTAALYGSTVTTGTATIALPVRASTATLYAPVASATYGLTGAFRSSTATLYSPTVVKAVYPLAGAFISAGSSLYAPTVAKAVYPLSAPVRASSLALYAPATSLAVYGLSTPAWSSSLTLHAPTITVAGAVSVAAPVIGSTIALAAPTVSATYGLTATLLAGTSALYAPSASLAVYPLVTPSWASSTSLSVPVVTSLASIALPGIDSALSLAAPTVTSLAHIAPAVIDSTTQLHAPGLVWMLGVPAIGSTAQVYAPSLRATYAITVPYIPSGPSGANLYDHIVRWDRIGPAPEPDSIPLIRALELPLPSTLTRILGIHQSDVVIRAAIRVGLADMRANPWLLDYVFASLPQDTLTWKEYGEKDLSEAKKWFTTTDIPVSVLPRMDESKWPQITIELLDSSEVVPEATLGDVHYDPEEDSDTTWAPLTPPFTPLSYRPSTGAVVLAVAPEVFIGPGMFLVDRNGNSHEIMEATDQQNFKLAAGTVADLRGCVLKSHRPSWKVSAESSSFRETYRIGVHCHSETSHLTWLHSILVFSLLRYKQVLMEARGFERSTIQSSQVARDERFESENIFSRYITITGYVRQYWPKTVAPVIDVLDEDSVANGGTGGLTFEGVSSSLYSDFGATPTLAKATTAENSLALWAKWDMNAKVGSQLADSASYKNLTIFGSPTLVPGVRGTDALQFTRAGATVVGSGGGTTAVPTMGLYRNLTADESLGLLGDSWSYGMWIKRDDLVSVPGLIAAPTYCLCDFDMYNTTTPSASANAIYRAVYLPNTGQIVITVSSPSSDGLSVVTRQTFVTQTLPIGVWTHLAVVTINNGSVVSGMYGATQNVYLDGELIYTSVGDGVTGPILHKGPQIVPNFTINKLMISNRYRNAFSSYIDGLDGTLDDVVIAKKAWSQDEVRRVMNGTF